MPATKFLMMDFTFEDKAFMQRRGSDPERVQKQFDRFQIGFDYVRLDRAATRGDGIVCLEDEEVEELAEDYAEIIKPLKVVKFVPASGAASRMFKSLIACLHNDTPETRRTVNDFLLRLHEFPFYEALHDIMQQHGHSLEHEIQKQNHRLIISYLLDEKGLNYGNLPKGLLPFHRYPNVIRTATEEHLVEAALYAQNQGQCYLHFTVSPEHLRDFQTLTGRVTAQYEQHYGVRYHIDFSVQLPSTDTPAAETDNTPFRDANGQLLFRPGGHGALIHNLNNLDADLIFIKNIDNVTTEDNLSQTIRYKKAMATYLLQLKHKIHSYVKLLKGNMPDNMLLSEIIDFMESDLMIPIGDEFTANNLLTLLNRPIRVCGMVRNTGDPGGGPFWVRDNDNRTTLQIVESAQINPQDKVQQEIMLQATHFNPVDIVCCIRDDDGKVFNLSEFVDPETGFISQKSYGDRNLKAMELPGLWNGAMSRWITIFVEVPAATFNPVKTAFDLLRT